MVSLRNYGVGTGYTSNGITGEKTTFAHDEKIYACHVWDNLGGGETFKIIWEQLVSGNYVEKVRHEWVNSANYSSAYQSAWIKSYPSGTWRVRFFLNSIFAGGKSFSIEGGVSCVENWSCTAWGPCVNNKQTRVCTDLNNCGTELHKPMEERACEIRRIAGRVTDFDTGEGIDGAKITFVDKSVISEPNGIYNIDHPAKMSAPIKCEADGYITLEGPLTAPVAGTLYVDFKMKKVGPEIIKLTEAQIAWLNKWKEDETIAPEHADNILALDTAGELTESYIIDVLGTERTAELLAKTEMPIEKTWWQKLLDIADWVIGFPTLIGLAPGVTALGDLWSKIDEKTNWAAELKTQGIDVMILEFPWWFAMPEGAILAGLDDFGVIGPNANKVVKAVKNHNWIKSAEWMKAHPVEAAKNFPKLPNTIKAQMLKTLSKDKLAVSLHRELEAANHAYIKTLDATMWSKLTDALKDPTTMRYSIAKIIKFLAVLAGGQFALEWSVKEGIIEPMVFPYTNELSAYRFNPTEERRDLIISMLERMEGKIPKATALMEALGWIFPPLKPLWDDIAGTYDTQLEDFRSQFDIIEIPPKTGTLRVSSNVENSDVYIDGTKRGTTPLIIKLEVGTYHILVTKFQYDSTEIDVDIVAGAEPNFVAQIFPIGEIPPDIEIPEIIKTTVRDIIDGDTIDTSLDIIDSEIKLPEYGTTGHARIRIVGINAPEKSPKGEILCTDIEVYEVEKSWTDASRDVLLPMNDKEVTLYIDPLHRVDTHGRLLAKVEYEGKDVGLEQIKRGYACWYFREENKYGDDELYKAETLKAQTDKTGMWSDLPEQPGTPPEELITFSIDSIPSNAPVFIDGVATHHNTPTDNVEQADVWNLWTEGIHTLKITKSGMVKEQEIDLIPGEHLELVVDLTELPPEVPPDEVPPDEEPPIPEEPDDKDLLIEELRTTLAELNATIQILNDRILELEGMPPTPPPEEPPVTPPTVPDIYSAEQLWALTTAFSELWTYIEGAQQLSAAEYEVFKTSYDLYSDEQKEILNIFFERVLELTKGAAQLSHKEYAELQEEFHI